MRVSRFLISATILLSISSCSKALLRPIPIINSLLLKTATTHREPSLGNDLLVTLANKQGKEIIELINIRNGKKIALPGANKFDAQVISISINSDGERMALIRQRGSKTELLIYRRRLGTIQKLEIIPQGVPKQVSIDAEGRVLAVQVSRNGRWDIDLIQIKS